MRGPNFYADLKADQDVDLERAVAEPTQDEKVDLLLGQDHEERMATYRTELDQLVSAGRIDAGEAMHRFRQRDNEALVASQMSIDKLLEDSEPERDFTNDLDGPYLGGGMRR